MIYATTYEDQKGLSASIPGYGDYDIAAGIDQNGNSFIKAGNNYFYSLSSIMGADGSYDGSGHLTALGVTRYIGQVPQPGQPQTISFDQVIANLKQAGVPFTAYVPPPAPSPIAPPSSPSAPAVPVQSVPWFPATDFTHHDGYDTVNAFGEILPVPPGGQESDWEITGELRPWTRVAHNKSTGFYVHKLPGQPPDWSPPQLVVPPGYVTIYNTWAPRQNAWPLYAANPSIKDGVTSFSGIKGFNSLTPSVTGQGNSVGLDTKKLALGIYAIKETPLGSIVQENGRTYELYLEEIFDTSTQASAGSFYVTTEGGGGGLLISNPIQLASRIITDIATWGTAEAVRAAAQKAGVPESTINLATELYAAAAVALATAGAITVLTAPAVSVAAVPTAGIDGVTQAIAGQTVVETLTAGEGGIVTASGLTAEELGIGTAAVVVPTAVVTTGAVSKIGTALAGEIAKLATVLGTGLANKAISNAINPPKSVSPPSGGPSSLTVNQAPDVPAAKPFNMTAILAAGAAAILFIRKRT